MSRKGALHPITPVLLLDDKQITNMPPESINASLIGEKAFGISCLPPKWILPFFVISYSLIDQARRRGSIVLDEWIEAISRCCDSRSFSPGTQLLIRSSAISEDIKQRGNFFSSPSDGKSLSMDLKKYIERVLADRANAAESICIIVQKRAECSQKGHLSNERRCSKEPRDWLGEYEKDPYNPHFQINLRDWREKVSVEALASAPLDCNLKVNIQKTLKAVAEWGRNNQNRMHFEWVWDGKHIYIVQAEEEKPEAFFNPESHTDWRFNFRDFQPKALTEISLVHATKYTKIRNVYVYLELSLATVPLYVLDDETMLSDIAQGLFADQLIRDLEHLVNHSLVIRMDVDTANQADRQMLPRTHEVRDLGECKDWLESNVRQVRSQFPGKNVALIFHNFVPSSASAFASASPKERKVEIEALWGIPEGLYYYSHDKFIVDTKHVEAGRAKLNDYDCRSSIRYKPYCVAPNQNGVWKAQKLGPPHDWKSSIRNENWISKIACDTKRIAEKEGKSVSVMWFIGVPASAAESPVLPWFHEEFDRESVRYTKVGRKKTPFDRTLTISENKDIQKLENAAESRDRNIKTILVRPIEEPLLRDKHTLERVGKLARSLNASILLEGATLSHAFYQLAHTGAAVVVENPFDDDQGARDFNKLVRDFIPEKIKEGGETVDARILTGDELIKALREKLVEESLEVLDAQDHDSVLDELADVLEVVTSLVSHLGANKEEIEKRRALKKERAGGFEKGLVLISTENPSPSSKANDNPSLPLEWHEQEAINANNQQNSLVPPQEIKRWTDRRIQGQDREVLLNLEVPILLGRWKEQSLPIHAGGESFLASLSCKRLGAKNKIEMSIVLAPHQPDLMDQD